MAKNFKNLISEGDIIFRHTDSLWGELAKSLSIKDHRFSHTGVIAHNGNSFVVVHADGDPMDSEGKVREAPINIFLQNSDSVAVYRLIFPPEVRKAIGKHALELSEAGIKFDTDFLLSTDDELYCTELVYKTIKHVSGIEVTSTANAGGVEYIAIDSLYVNDYTELVFNTI